MQQPFDTTPSNANTLSCSLEDILGSEGIQRHVISYACFPSLHLMRLNRTLMGYAHAEMGRRALRVTDAHVVAGKHMERLREFVQQAEAGQTICLASGTYTIGDESVDGHANRTIIYDTNGEKNGGDTGQGMMDDYGGDCDWNSWLDGWGPLYFRNPGVKLVGPNLSEELAILFFNATPGWSEDPIAFHINVDGVVLERLTFQGHCEAIDVGMEDIGEDYTSKPFETGSALPGNAGSRVVCLLGHVPRPSSGIASFMIAFLCQAAKRLSPFSMRHFFTWKGHRLWIVVTVIRQCLRVFQNPLDAMVHCAFLQVDVSSSKMLRSKTTGHAAYNYLDGTMHLI